MFQKNKKSTSSQKKCGAIKLKICDFWNIKKEFVLCAVMDLCVDIGNWIILFRKVEKNKMKVNGVLALWIGLNVISHVSIEYSRYFEIAEKNVDRLGTLSWHYVDVCQQLKNSELSFCYTDLGKRLLWQNISFFLIFEF